MADVTGRYRCSSSILGAPLIFGELVTCGTANMR